MAKPRTPAGLGPAGRRLWRGIVDDLANQGLVLRPDEEATLEAACRQADTNRRLEGALAEADLLVTGSQGQPVPNPLLAELRQGRGLLAQMIARLKLGNVAQPETQRSRSARRAANARWSGAGVTRIPGA